MIYKTIAVILNEIERAPELIAAATELATRFQAHVDGLYIVPGIDVYPAPAYAAGAAVNDTLQKHFLAKRPEVQKAFEKAMSSNGLTFGFQSVDALSPVVAPEAAKHSRAAELIIVSAVNPEGSMGSETGFVERLVIAAGRPVLVLPAKGELPLRFDDVIVAWDQSREASRAAADALPLLKLSRNVHVATVDPPMRGEVAGASIAEALSRYGMAVQTVSVSSDGLGVAEALMRAAHDKGAGLIVMGAYGHSHFAEFVFGGATRSMIHDLDRPVLMSH